MINVAECLVQAHDLTLVGLAAVVCLVASMTAFHLAPKIVGEQARSSVMLWLSLTAAVAGSGVWATHFIAMLAFQPLVPIAYEIGPTFVSLLVSIMVSFGAFALLLLPVGRIGRLGAGVLLGLATVAMHYTGVSGLRLSGTVAWNVGAIWISAILSVLFATPALLVGVSGQGAWRRNVGAGLFAVSIVALHFTGMSAITLVPDPSVGLEADLLSGSRLGFGIAAVSVAITACAIAARLIDRRARLETDERMRFLARHDALTALPNRVLFEEIVTREMVSRGVRGQTTSVLSLDLDGFKEVNDAFGHAAGDKLLVEVADRLRRVLENRCVAARLGGDEFGILALRQEGPEHAARSVIQALAVPFEVEGSRVEIGCSIGIAVHPQDGASYAHLMSSVDVAQGRAKGDGKGGYRFFEASMDEALRERRSLAQDLRAAIGTDQIRLEYQPQFTLATNRVSGFEALLRWRHPVRGAISPGTFIPLAEETGLILPIGEWALREACREAATWPAPVPVAVNLSVAQFKQAGLPDLVRGILGETGLSPERLELEVTESVLFDGSSRSTGILHEIKSTGVRIAMDDFGTGYSSLLTLQSFPFDKIKIDRSFTEQIGISRKGTAIVKSIIALGDNLDMQVIAEGIETEEQFAFLREQGCGEMQGFLRGRPRPICDYLGLMEDGARGTVIQLRRA